jgi:monothiol glutaredoxin
VRQKSAVFPLQSQSWSSSLIVLGLVLKSETTNGREWTRIKVKWHLGREVVKVGLVFPFVFIRVHSWFAFSVSACEIEGEKPLIYRLMFGRPMAMYIAELNAMNKPKIIAYLKPSCGWSQGVRAIMRKYDLPYEDRDIINDPMQRQEMIEKSGQMLSPCVEINGRMLPDISGEEVEAYLLANALVENNDRAADAPTNQPCAHEMPQSSPLQFRR